MKKTIIVLFAFVNFIAYLISAACVAIYLVARGAWKCCVEFANLAFDSSTKSFDQVWTHYWK